MDDGASTQSADELGDAAPCGDPRETGGPRDGADEPEGGTEGGAGDGPAVLVERALEGVAPEWRVLLDLGLLAKILGRLAGVDTAPPLPLVLEALRYGRPADVAAVLISQDPYPG